MEFKINKPVVNWTNKQVNQIETDLMTYLIKHYGDEIVDAEITNFKSKNPDFHNVSTMYVTIEYIFYTPWWEEDEDNPDPRDGKPQTMGTTIYADGERCLSDSIYDVFTTQEHYIINCVQEFFETFNK